ncbi:MAG: DUF2332 domain-containing protein [Microthrixaceae bacterium]
MSRATTPGELAQRFTQQATACAELGSDLYGRLGHLLAQDIADSGPTWGLIAEAGDLRFGQAAPLRLLGAAHRLALTGDAPRWAEVLPSCGGAAPTADVELLDRWLDLVASHHDELAEGLQREVQTNEVARASGLAFALAQAGLTEARLVEIGCSGGLNLGLDAFEVDLGGLILGKAGSDVRLRPEVRTAARSRSGVGATLPEVTGLPEITGRVGIDVHPIDPRTDEGRLTLLSFVWPDQTERVERVRAAIGLAVSLPTELLATGGADRTAEVLGGVLQRGGACVVMQSIMWQYVPPEHRWQITESIEQAGRSAGASEPLAWIRFEPDPWDRRRAAIWLRRWPDGGDRLVAHVDYHGRWIEPL